jgi:ATP-binding cassette subfamily F protein 3
MDEYKDLVLERAGGARRSARKLDKPELVPAAPKKPGKGHIPLRKQIETLEERMAKFQGLIARIDQALADPETFRRDKGKAATLAQQRKECERALAAVEEEWLLLTTESEAAQ